MSMNPVVPTRGNILSGFNKTINRLETLVSQNARAEIIATRLKALIADA